MFRIARRVAKDRVISTVDPEARHGHKTAARSFDGYKGHVAMGPDSELITATEVTAGNVGDADPAPDLLADDLPDRDQPVEVDQATAVDEPDDADRPADGGHDDDEDEERLSVYGDSAYGAGALLDTLEGADADINCKVQPPVAPGGRYAKDAFQIDLQAGMVTCPAGQTAPLREQTGGQIARFGTVCAGCPLAAQCTTSTSGRTIRVGPHEAQLTRARQRQTDPALTCV